MPAPVETPTPFDDGALYDLLLGDIDYGTDFYLELAQAARGPVLDVGCGTGRILLKWLDAGIDGEGLDLSAALLERLREKALARRLQPRVHQADMRTFQLGRRFSLITIIFNAFMHNLTTDEQLATLARCREHLVPGGVIAFDAYVPSLELLAAPENTRDLELEMTHPETGLPVRLYDTRSFDRVGQLQHSRMDVEMLDAKGDVMATHPSQTTVRWIYKPEMELLLRLAGFARWEIYGGFDRRPLTKETDALIVVAWEPGTGAAT
jgi:SAM-dependent methyltransferase